MSEWIEHDGSGVPNGVSLGVRLSAKNRAGKITSGVVGQRQIDPETFTLNELGQIVRNYNPLFWAVSGREEYLNATDVVAYRFD